MLVSAVVVYAAAAILQRKCSFTITAITFAVLIYVHIYRMIVGEVFDPSNVLSTTISAGSWTWASRRWWVLASLSTSESNTAMDALRSCLVWGSSWDTSSSSPPQSSDQRLNSTSKTTSSTRAASTLTSHHHKNLRWTRCSRAYYWRCWLYSSHRCGETKTTRLSGSWTWTSSTSSAWWSYLGSSCVSDNSRGGSSLRPASTRPG